MRNESACRAQIQRDLAALRAPVLGFFAGKDDFVSPEVVRELDAQLTALGKEHEVTTYQGCDHAFFNDDRPEVYDAAAARDTWQKMLDFYRQHLG